MIIKEQNKIDKSYVNGIMKTSNYLNILIFQIENYLSQQKLKKNLNLQIKNKI